MKILVIGNGGREHALAWKLGQSPGVEKVLVAPGNAGTANELGMQNVPVAATDIDGLLDLAKKEQVDLTVVGPEAPLVAGVVDRFQQAGLRCFGPSKAAARLEGSKAFSKDFLVRYRIPTALHATFDSLEPALAYVREHGAPIVIKADGLAAGKGVVVAMTLPEAEQALVDMLDGRTFGEASASVVIEQFLEGEEASYIVVSDGKNALPLASSQDHKRRDDGDKGPNTGGMGAYSPAPVVTPEVEQRIVEQIVEPTLQGMANEGHPFVGFLYVGLMIDAQGMPSVIEFNVRMGDPETQPLLMRLNSDLVELLKAAIDGHVDSVQACWDQRPALGVVMASGGYPGSVRKGVPINGLETTPSFGSKVFQAGTKLDGESRPVTNGGRVLCACALGEDLAAACERAYEMVAKIRFDGGFYRHDIGHRAFNR